MSIAERRQERLAGEIRDEVAQMLERELKDPRLGFTTVTRVELSSGLQHARVLVSILGDAEAQQATLEDLASASGFIRREISHRLRLRRAPEMVFVLDRGAEASEQIEAILRKLHEPS